eukprot:jgi/Tetstr1/440873/TSEL_029146.t1
MSGSGSPTAPKMADSGKAAAAGSAGMTATWQDSIEAGRRKAEDIRLKTLKQLIQEQLSMFFTTQETFMRPATAGEEDAIPGGNASRANGQDRNVHSEASYGAFRRVHRTTHEETYLLHRRRRSKAPWSELVRASIEALYGTGGWCAKVLDMLTTSLTANTYSNYEGKIRLFAEFCIDKEGILPWVCTESTCARYLA